MHSDMCSSASLYGSEGTAVSGHCMDKQRADMER